MLPIAGKFKDAMGKVRTGFERGTSSSVDGGKASIFASPKSYVEEIKANVPEGLGYAGGRVAGDFMKNASRGGWWLVNNAEAVAQLGTDKVAKIATQGLGDMDNRSKTLVGSVLGGALATTSGTFDIGNFNQAGRKAGTEALFYDKDVEDPKLIDRTKTIDPLREIGSRYVLGARGNMLPKWDYLDERPDVTPQEYDELTQYKRQKGILKGTWKGDTGTPTLTFLHYDMPIESLAATVATGYGLGKYLNAKQNYGNNVAQPVSVPATNPVATAGTPRIANPSLPFKNIK